MDTHHNRSSAVMVRCRVDRSGVSAEMIELGVRTVQHSASEIQRDPHIPLKRQTTWPVWYVRISRS